MDDGIVMDKMSYVWRAMAKKDCQNSIDTIRECIIAFPELLAWTDEESEVRGHLEKVCELLHLDSPWGEDDGS